MLAENMQILLKIWKYLFSTEFFKFFINVKDANTRMNELIPSKLRIS
jgi:hypothetical protein